MRRILIVWPILVWLAGCATPDVASIHDRALVLDAHADVEIPGGGIEAMNVTAGLVASGYGPDEIEKIWGGNFLRVFREVSEGADHSQERRG